MRNNFYGEIDLSTCTIASYDGSPLEEYDTWGSLDFPFDPLLGPLQSNNNSPATHALQPGSPAIDFASSANPTSSYVFSCPANDETIRTRPVGPYCDPGSYEYR
jgi:hypothetical protein